MKRPLLPWLATLLTAVLLSACGSAPPDGRKSDSGPPQHQMTVTDGAGRQVEIQVPVRRVVAFNTFNVEFIRAVGAFDAVVGLDGGSGGPSYEGYWPGFDTSRFAGAGQAEPDYEKLVELDPEVVIFPSNGAWQDAERKLEPFGIDVLVITGWDQSQHVFNVDLIGQLFDKQNRANELNSFYTKYNKLLKDRLRDVPPVPVYVENEADYASPIPGSGWHDMITLAGGRNIFGSIEFDDQTAKGSVHAFSIEPEAILAARPELVLRLAGGGYAPGSSQDRDELAHQLLDRPGWKALPAVLDDNVWITNSFPMNACSKIIGSLYLAKWLHPDLFEDVDPDAVMSEWITGFQDVPLDDPGQYYQRAS